MYNRPEVSLLMKRRTMLGATAVITGLAGCADDGGPIGGLGSGEDSTITFEDVPGVTQDGVTDREQVLDAFATGLAERSFSYEQLSSHTSQEIRATVNHEEPWAYFKDFSVEGGGSHFYIDEEKRVERSDDDVSVAPDGLYEQQIESIIDDIQQQTAELFELLEFGTPAESSGRISIPITGIDSSDVSIVEGGALELSAPELISQLQFEAEQTGEGSFTITATVSMDADDIEKPEWADIELSENPTDQHNPELVERVSDVEPGESFQVNGVITEKLPRNNDIEGERIPLFDSHDIQSLQKIEEVDTISGSYLGMYLGSSGIQQMRDVILEEDADPDEVNLVSVLDGDEVLVHGISRAQTESIINGDFSEEMPLRITAAEQDILERIAATILAEQES